MGYVVGINPTQTVASLNEGKGFALGTLGQDNEGNVYVYCQASGAITGEGYACFIDESFQAALLSTSNDDFGDRVGIAPVAFADNEYGWVQVYGICNIQVAASAAANAVLMTTATAGQLDDTATGVSVAGAILTTARGGTAGTAAGFINWPTIGATVA